MASDNNGANQASKSGMSEAELEELVQRAITDLNDASTRQAIKEWWLKYYLKLGHRRLGRILIGKPPRRSISPKSLKKRNLDATAGSMSSAKGDAATRVQWRGPKRMT